MDNETIRINLTGNPNVGKSTIFNMLTGLHQHTGNWSGKTVEVLSGSYKYKGNNYIITDLGQNENLNLLPFRKYILGVCRYWYK